MMALAGVELETLVSEPDALTTRPPWGAMSVKGTVVLLFLTPGTTTNGAKYLQLLKNKLQFHMNVHECTIFMQDGAPCHKAKIVSNFLKSKKDSSS